MNGNPLSSSEPWNMVAEGYAETTQLMLAEYAKEALELGGITLGDVVADVACGPGTLSLLAVEKGVEVKALDFSQSMLSVFQEVLDVRAISEIQLTHGDGQSLPYSADHFDAAFSMFGLMFFPDRFKGFSELYRVLKPGKKAVVSSWAPLDQSPEMKMMFEIIKVIKPDLPEPGTVVDTLQDPLQFKREMEHSQFTDVVIHRVEKEFTINSIEEYWGLMNRGSVPIVMLKNNMEASQWIESEKRALSFLSTRLTAMPVVSSMCAFIGVGVKPK
ncbi:MAG: methyltransferase domain-containing protein [Fibrobacterales bacterium]